ARRPPPSRHTLPAGLGGRAQVLLTRAASRPSISSIDTSTMDSPRTPGSFLPLPDAELEILIALADGEAHGYAIMRGGAERAGGGGRAGPGPAHRAAERLSRGSPPGESGREPRCGG